MTTRYVSFPFVVLVLFTVSVVAGCGGSVGDDSTASVSAAAPSTSHTLAVQLDGAGSVSAAPGINCGSDCTESYQSGTTVTLTATPAADYELADWSVNNATCASATSCTVAMTASRSVTARFAPRQRTLSVSVGGSGRVTSSPAGIDCGTDCSENYPRHSSVTLTAAPASGYTFSGWSGDGGCGAAVTCTLSMAAARSVNATFSPVAATQYMLQIARSGSGGVASAPAGINCGTDCSESYASGTAVTLTATPASGYSFAGWSGGGCSGTGACVVSMSMAQTVSANFVASTYTLVITKQGAGTVTSVPAGINCGTDCSEPYNSGASITLTAAAASGYIFSGWSGSGIACAGTGACAVSMTAARTVTATFSVQPSYALSVTKSGSGSVTSTPAGINCGADCSESYVSGTAVTLSAVPASGYTFGGWGGACTGVSSCSVSLTQTRAVSASFLAAVPVNTYSLTWDPVVDPRVTGYRLYYSSTPLTSVAAATAIDVATATYVFNPAAAGIARGATIYFAVASLGGGLESPLSTPVSAIME
jgi:hypothetical protein